VRWAPAVKLPSRDFSPTKAVPRTEPEQKAGKTAVHEVFSDTNGDYRLRQVPNINVTGQSEESVRNQWPVSKVC
jgi:hypothetical protein